MKKSLLLFPFLLVMAAPAQAKDYTIKMITQRFTMHPYRFEPNNLTIQSGDTVTFVDEQNDRHDVMFMIVPKGAEFAMSPMLHKKGETWSYKFTKAGTYQYHCHPHEEWGMTGTIIVGKPSQPEELQKMEHHHHDENGGDDDDMQDMKGMDMDRGHDMKEMDHHDHQSMNTDHHDHAGMNMAGKEGMSGMDHHGHMAMAGFYGGYSMNREASGTAWVPESTPMEGVHAMYGDWMTMFHGNIDLVYDHQGGRRGDDKTFAEGMVMAMANRPLGDGTWGLRAMLSPDPAMGKNGYPLLLQTGETADGKTPLIDRQHPHDLFMELATTYSHPIDKDSSVFGYIGYPGEPALGPPTFMHRYSGMDNPEAPIGHHWLDSTHVDFGVVTAGYIWNQWKIEGSVFNGREPDQYRWNFDPMRLNSYSARLSYNPTPGWSFQISHGFIKSPEQLEPDVDQHRTTASAIYNRPLKNGNWQTTVALGLDNNDPGRATNAVLLESAVSWQDKHTVFGRAEWVQKDELFATGPLAGHEFDVGKFSLGYIYDMPVADHLTLGIGGLGSIYALPGGLDSTYGNNPASVMIFARLKLK